MRLDVPANHVALDQAVYPAGPAGGDARDAFLLKRLAQNDRKLAAVLRCAGGKPYPLTNLPRACDLIGRELVAEEQEVSPLCYQVDWRVRGLIPGGQVLWAVAWCEGVGSPQPWAPPPCPQAVQLLGTGAAVNYGPIACKVRPGHWLLGLTLWSTTIDATAVATGQVADYSDARIQSTAGSFGGLAAPPCRAINLSRGVGVGAPPIGGRYQVASVATTTIANDTALVLPATLERDFRGLPPLATLVGWQLWRTSYMDVYSWSYRERQVTGTLGDLP